MPPINFEVDTGVDLPFTVDTDEPLPFELDPETTIEIIVDPVSLLIFNEPEHYSGEYDVTPLITAQILYTAAKLMDDNVRVDMIPTSEEINASGGVTFKVG